MGKPGPIKQPQAIAKLKGTYRPVRYGGDQTKTELDFINADSGYPDPPEFLEEKGRRQWVSIMKKAAIMGNWICWEDLPSLEAYCRAYDDMVSSAGAERYEFLKDGRRVLSAEYKLFKESALLLDRLSQRFGLDPSAKSSFNWGKDDENEDDFVRLKI